MHKYHIEIYRYTEFGAAEPHHFVTYTADNELQLQKIVDQYDYEKMTVMRGEEEVQIKAYKVVAYELKYVKIADVHAEINSIFGE